MATWIEKVEESKFFISNVGTAYVQILLEEGRTKIVPVKGKEFKSWVRYQAYHEDNKVIEGNVINDFIDTMHAKAVHEGKKIDPFIRIGVYNEVFFYDLLNGKYIKITEDGYEIVDNVPICFLTNDTMFEQVMPQKDKKVGIFDLKEFVNVKDEETFELFIVILISYFIPQIPHFIMILNGPQGSSKSTLSRMIKAIIDPSGIDIYSFPKNKEDLVLHLNNAYLIPYDNLDTIKSEYNDVLCQVSTGGQYVKRKLYSDSDIVVYKLYRALILNGINVPSSQSDLLDRSIIFSLKTIDSTERKTEKQLISEFKKKIPSFLHDIFCIISDAKEIYPTLTIEGLPRMSDAALWCCAIAEAMGIGSVRFLELYNNNQKEINSDILGENVVAYTLTKFMEKRNNWEGSVTDLWKILKDIVESNDLNKNDSTWARSPSYLSRHLNRLKMNLQKENIYFETMNAGSYKKIIVQKKNK